MRTKKSPPRALPFDVFGTVVDWRGCIIREGRKFGRDHGLARQLKT